MSITHCILLLFSDAEFCGERRYGRSSVREWGEDLVDHLQPTEDPHQVQHEALGPAGLPGSPRSLH